MAKIYVAANEVPRAKTVMDMLIKAGHSITFDWTTDIGPDERQEDKPVIAVTDHGACFFALPEVVQIKSDDEIVDAVNKI